MSGTNSYHLFITVVVVIGVDIKVKTMFCFSGSGSGIGRAVCQVLAKEGARIAAVDVNSSGAAETVTHLIGQYPVRFHDVIPDTC